MLARRTMFCHQTPGILRLKDWKTTSPQPPHVRIPPIMKASVLQIGPPWYMGSSFMTTRRPKPMSENITVRRPALPAGAPPRTPPKGPPRTLPRAPAGALAGVPAGAPPRAPLRAPLGAPLRAPLGAPLGAPTPL